MTLGPVLLLTAIFFLTFIARVTLSPLLPAIERDLHLSHTQGGTLFLAISIGYVIALLGSGFLASRWTHRRVILLSASCTGVSLLGAASAEGLWHLRFWMLGLGVAAGIYLPSGMAALTSLVDSDRWGRAIAIHELAPNLGFLLAPLLAEALMVWLPWRGTPTVLGLTALLVALAFARFGRGGDFCGHAPAFHAVARLAARPVFLGMMALFSLGISGTLGVYTMLPVYLVHGLGIGRAWANTLVGLSRIVPVGAVFFGGWATDRVGPGRTMGIALLLAGSLTALLGMLAGVGIVAVVFLQPMAAVAFYPAGFAALSRVVAPERRNLAVSLTLPTAFLVGGGVVPASIGILGDAGAFTLAFGLLGGIIAAGGLLALALVSDQDAANGAPPTARSGTTPPPQPAGRPTSR